MKNNSNNQTNYISSANEQQEALLSRRRRRTPSPQPDTSKKPRLSPTLSLNTIRTPVTSNGSNSMSIPPLSLSILGVEPLDEFIKEIADWIHELIMTRPNLDGTIEVEAKLGLLKNKQDDKRVNFPVRVETILSDNEGHRFESNMTAIQHKHFNVMLNSLEQTSRQQDHPSSPLRYQHSYLKDSFYNPEDRSGDKVRVTRDEKTGDVKECLKKIRLGNLDIYSPKWNADWRVSVNLEVPVAHPLGSATLSRRKDRLSYAHEEFVIDLTQVTQAANQGSPPQIMHELEIEFARSSVLLSTAAVRGSENVPPIERDAFDELVRAFVNNVRILVRNTRPPV